MYSLFISALQRLAITALSAFIPQARHIALRLARPVLCCGDHRTSYTVWFSGLDAGTVTVHQRVEQHELFQTNSVCVGKLCASVVCHLIWAVAL
jgi:hypothetical protein